MTTRRLPRRFVLLLALAALPLHAGNPPAGDDYRLVDSTFDGGTPQTSADAASGITLRGSIGQPDAAVSAAGAYRLDGGFWAQTRSERGPVIFSDGFESP